MKKTKVIPSKYLPVKIPLVSTSVIIHMMVYYKVPLFVLYPTVTLLVLMLIASIVSKWNEVKDESLINKIKKS